MTERYATHRGLQIFTDTSNQVKGLDYEASKALLWELAEGALIARDPESVYGVLRVADTYDFAAEMRFSIAMKSMTSKCYDCAYAAWDDGGNCWCKASSDDDSHVPASDECANTMKSVCVSMLESTPENQLCDMMRGM